MAIQILQDVAIHGGIQFIDAKADFPENPSIGTMILKGTAIYAYITIGGMETWYPFANRTNSYVHTQGLAATSWYINHNLHTTDVWVQIKDDSGKIVMATVTQIDADNTRIDFTTAIKGTAVIVAPDSIDVPEIKASLITVGPNVEINTNGVLINGSYALTEANIEQQIADAIAVETTARQTADATLTTDLTAETSARIAGDAGITVAINAEVTARQNADTTLTNNLAAETTARTTADATLASNLSAEVTTRQAAITGLTNDLATESSARQAADATLTANLAAEVTARQSAVTSLQTQVSGKLDASAVGVSVASLVGGLVPPSQLPSYVDDVVEFSSLSAFPVTGETGKIYIAKDTNKTYRWSGSQYVFITSGAVDSVNGKTGIVSISKSDIGLGNVDDTPDLDKVVLSASKLTTSRTVAVTGDVTGSGSFDGSANLSISSTLANSGVTAGTYPKVTVDAKGRVTVGSTLLSGDIPDLSATYQPKNANLTAVSGISVSSTGLVKFTNGVASLDSASYITGNQSISVSGDATGSGTTAITLTLANSGVTAGTYKSVTVDAKGRVTSGSNPTTLVGYGITDAAPLSHVSDASLHLTTAQNSWIDAITATSSEVNYLSGVTSSIQTQLNGKQASLGYTAENTANKGAVNGYAGLDSSGKVPASQLPSYVDDVLEFANLASFPATGETSKIYIALDTNKTYRWSGSAYIYITSGAVDSVAGKTGVVTLIASDVGLGNVDNTADVNKNVLSATKLTTARTVSISGDVSGSTSFDGSNNVSITSTLANSGVTAGTYKSVTVDAKGRVTAGTNPTTLAGYGITDALSANNNLPLTQGAVSSATLTTTTTAANQVVDSNAINSVRTVKYLVQITSGSSYQSSEILVIHDDSNAYVSEFGTVFSYVKLADFDADISSNNLRLLVTPVNAASVIKVIKTVVNV